VRLFKVTNPEAFDEMREEAMDVHFAVAANGGSQSLFVVVGGRVAIDINEDVDSPIQNYLDQHWLRPTIRNTTEFV
jgi:hypothetical protein